MSSSKQHRLCFAAVQKFSACCKQTRFTFEVMVADAIGLQQGRRWDDYHIVAHAHLCFTHLKHGFAEDGKNQQVRLRTSRKLMQP